MPVTRLLALLPALARTADVDGRKSAGSIANGQAADLLWSETATWNGCTGEGAPVRLYSGAVLDLGDGSVLLEGGDFSSNQGLATYYRLDAATGEVKQSIPQPLRGICTAIAKQSNGTLQYCDVMGETFVGLVAGGALIGTGSADFSTSGGWERTVGIYGLDPLTGELQWSRIVHNCTGVETPDDEEAGHQVALTPGGSLLLVVCGDHRGVSSAFDPATGAHVWSVPNRQLLPPATGGCDPQCLSHCGGSLCAECCCPGYNPFSGPKPTKDCHGSDDGVCGASASTGCGDKLPLSCKLCHSSGVNGAVTWTIAFLDFAPDGAQAYLGWAPERSGPNEAAAAGQVVAVSAADGGVLWRGPQNNTADAGSRPIPVGVTVFSSALVVEFGSEDSDKPTPAGTVAFEGLDLDDGGSQWTRRRTAPSPCSQEESCPPAPVMQACAANCSLPCSALWAGSTFGVLAPRTGATITEGRDVTVTSGVHATWNSSVGGLLSLAVVAATACPAPPPPPPPGPPNECQPAKGCNVCTACCKDYVHDGRLCDKCVEEACQPAPPAGPGFVVANLSVSSCGGVALLQLPLPPINGTGGGVEHTASADDSPWTHVTVVSATGGSIALVGGHRAPLCPERGQRRTTPAFAAFAAIRLTTAAVATAVGHDE